MQPSSNPPPIPGSYVWTYPGCPLQVLLSLDVIERLRFEILGPTLKDRETSGLLIGPARSKPGLTNVVDFIPAPPADPATPRFRLTPEFLDEVIQRCPSDQQVVGFYRTSKDQLVRLSVEDVKLIQQRFEDASKVFLVIAPLAPQPVGGFFCWQNGTLAANSSLTFPLSVAALASSGWPIQTGQPIGERLANLGARIAAPVKHASSRAMHASLRAKAASLALLVVLLAISGLLLVKQASSARSSAAHSNLALQVERNGQSFVLTWDQSAPEIASAKGASLEITEGHNPSSLLTLTPQQLRSGNLTYGSFPFIERTEFHLEVVGPTGETREESASISPGAGASEAIPLPPPPPPRRVTDSARASRPRSEHAPVDVNYPPIPKLVDRSLVASTVTDPPPAATQNELPEAPRIIPSLTAPPRAFVPPAPGMAAKMASDTLLKDLPEPPQVGRLVLPWTTVPLVLANSVPVNRSMPPSRTTPGPLSPAMSRAALLAQPSAGVLTITSEPSGASVEINEVFAGSTPLALQISPIGLGFTVTVTKSGFMKWSIQSVVMDKPYGLHAQLTER